MLKNLNERAKQLKTDIPAVFIAMKHRDTPFIAKIIAATAIIYALSPVDLIPDFIPVIGLLDDVTCADDELSKKLEPNAPPTSERLDWAVHLAEAGYMVILAFNPLVEKWMPKKALEDILDVSISAGIRNFYFDSLHLEKKRTYPKELLELTGVTMEYLDSASVDWDTENFVLDAMEGRDAAFYLPWAMRSSLVYLNLIDVLGGGFRPVESYLACIEHGLSEGFSGFTWDSFYEWMSEGNEALFEKELPLSWMERYTYIQQRQIYMEHPPLSNYNHSYQMTRKINEAYCRRHGYRVELWSD